MNAAWLSILRSLDTEGSNHTALPPWPASFDEFPARDALTVQPLLASVQPLAHWSDLDPESRLVELLAELAECPADTCQLLAVFQRVHELVKGVSAMQTPAVRQRLIAAAHTKRQQCDAAWSEGIAATFRETLHLLPMQS